MFNSEEYSLRPLPRQLTIWRCSNRIVAGEYSALRSCSIPPDQARVAADSGSDLGLNESDCYSVRHQSSTSASTPESSQATDEAMS